MIIYEHILFVMPDRDPRLRASNGSLNLIGERVKARRKAINMRQNEFIKKIAGVTGGNWTPSRVDVTRIETGLRSCLDTETVAIAAVLDIDVLWLLVGDDSPKEGVRKEVRAWQFQPKNDRANTASNKD